jgi:hypothetical protein
LFRAEPPPSVPNAERSGWREDSAAAEERHASRTIPLGDGKIDEFLDPARRNEVGWWRAKRLQQGSSEPRADVTVVRKDVAKNKEGKAELTHFLDVGEGERAPRRIEDEVKDVRKLADGNGFFGGAAEPLLEL